MNWHELHLEQQADLDHKIAIANRVIAEAFSTGTRPALAFSGGKDSTVLWHLIRSHLSDKAQDLIVWPRGRTRTCGPTFAAMMCPTRRCTI